jgi:hypothetical protein
MLRVCSLQWRVERRYTLGSRKETLVDSAGKCVVCLKGFEDDGRSLTVTGRHYPKQPPSADLPRIFDKRLNVPVVRFALELSSSDLT